MEENFERDNRKGKAKVEDTDQDSLPPKSNRNKDDEYYYVKLFGQLRCKDAYGPDSLEGVTRSLFRVRDKDIVSFLGNEDEKLKIIHRDSGATIGISSDPVSRIHSHSYLELLGTVDQVKIAEILMKDAIQEMYKKPFVPTPLMPTSICQHGMIVPLLKVSPLLGVNGNNLVKMEVESGAWIELNTIEPSSDGKSWVRRVSIYGSRQQITNAMDMINRGVSEEPVIPEDIWDTVPPEDIWDWDTVVDGIISTDEAEHQESANLEGENEQHAIVEETAHNDSVEEVAANEDNGSDQLGNGKERVEEKEACSPNSKSNSI